jgi:threonine/homoserine/homoserine lactone efflux protein
MQHIIDGIYLGLALAFLLGPIFIVLIQTSLLGGARAGLVAGSGIWVSDIIIVTLTLMFIKKIDVYVQNPNFTFYVGMIGGLILISVGLKTTFKKSTLNFDADDKPTAKGWLSIWMKGFIVNTVNPFTFIFWLSTITSYVATKKLTLPESQWFVGAILVTIIITDSLKVLLAKMIRPRINEKSLLIVNKVAGSALILFGFALLMRSVFY